MKTPCYITRLIGNLVIFSLIFSQNFAYASQNLPITPDGSTNTQVGAAANGVPVVNIAAPNSGGLSHNKYTDYNVNTQGLILNNATGNQNGVVSTQIGGIILDNPNLKNSGAASVILNEVTSTNKSYINGYTEIAGKKADLIIANPNGISVNGAGFINTARLTMVIGSSNQNNPTPDNLTFFLKNNSNDNSFLPSLTIEGLGIDLEQVSESDLVANVMKIVAPIYGGENTVNLRSGDNQFSYKDKSTTSFATEGEVIPDSIAIDASALGKIQAGKIYIIATKEGFGVKYSGDMIASRNGINIDSKGNIEYNNIAATSGDINITSSLGSITTNDTTYNSSNDGSINLTAKGDINLNSQLISNNNILINTDSDLINNTSDINIAAKDFTINANNLINNGSLIANNLNINSLSLTQNNGSITAENILQLTSLNINNDNGSLSGTNGIDLTINSDDYEITGSIISGGYLNITGNNIINQTNLSANTDISITANNNFTNGTFNTDNPEVNDDIFIASNNNVTITATNDVKNYATISATNNLTLESLSGNISNNKYAEIIGGTGELKLTALNGTVNQFSDNSLVSYGDLTLSVVDFVNSGRVDIAGDFTLNVENDLINEEGALIYSGNDMTLNVGNNLTNNKDATIYAENNLTIQKYGIDDERYDVDNNRINKFENIAGNIETYQGDITIKAETFINTRNIDPVTGLLAANSNCSGGGSYIGCNRGGVIYKANNHDLYNWIYFNGSIWGEFGRTDQYRATIGVTQSNSKASQIISGNNLTIDTNSFTNHISEISAKNNINLNLSQFNNNSLTYAQTAVWNVVSDKPYGGGCNASGYCYSTSYDLSNFKTYSGSIKAGGSISIVQNGTLNTSLVNGSTVDDYAEVGGVSGRDLNVINNINVNNILENGIVNNDLSYYINGSDYQGMFKKSENANGPLFETRSQFVDQSKFFGSNYFYTQIGVDLDELEEEFQQQNQRLVGDQFFQTKIIKDQLAAIKKNSLLLSESTIDTNTEIKDLLDNAASEYARLGLTQNQSLTQAQIDNLEKDIVWFETEQIAGQTYIVPKVYLSKTTRENLKNNDSLTSKSTIFAKNNVNIETQGSLTNHGSINGGNVTISTTNNIENTNFSNITATDSLTLTSSEGSIINRSELKANGDLTISAGDNFYNLATIETNAQNLLDENNNHTDTQIYRQNNSGATNSGNIRSELIETASISGRNVTITAANDVNNLAANIESTGDLTINAGDDINISTLQLRDRTVTHWGTRKKGGVSISDTTTNISSNLTSAGNLTLSSNADINVIGSSLTSADNLSLSAKDDVNIISAQDSSYFYSAGRTGRGKSYGYKSTSTTQVSSELTTTNNGNITINSGVGNTDVVGSSDAKGSINIVASKLTTTDTDQDGSNNVGSGNIDLTAKENIVISSALNTKYEESSSTKKSSTVKKTNNTTTSTTTNVKSTLDASGDINSTSGNHTLILASDLTAQGSGNIFAGKYVDQDASSETFGQEILNENANLNIYNGKDTYKFFSKTTTEKTGLSLENAVMTGVAMAAIVASGGASAGLILGSGLGSAAIGSVNQQKNTKITQIERETIVASNLNFGKSLSLTAANDVDVKASNLKSGQLNIEGEKDLNITAGNNVILRSDFAQNLTSHELKEKGNYFFKNGNSGNYNTKVTNTEIDAGGDVNNLNISAGNVIITEYKEGSKELASSNQNLAYLNNLDETKTVFSELSETNKSWDQTSRGLTSAGQVVVAITAAAVTGGAASGIGASAGGATAGATGSSIAGAVVQGAVTAGITSTAVTAATTAASLSMNADGDLFKQLKDIGKSTGKELVSEESLKNTAISMAAAGLTAGILKGIEVASSTASTAGSTSNAANTANSANNATSTLDRIQTAMIKNGVSTISSSAAQSAINGDSFGESLKNQAVNAVVYAAAEVAANEIGDLAHPGDGTPPEIGKPVQYAMHAGLGAATAAATGNDAVSGAIAGVVGEIAGETLRDSMKQGDISKQSAINASGLVSALTVSNYGNFSGQSDQEIADNMFEGNRIGGNAVENNLLYSEIVEDNKKKEVYDNFGPRWKDPKTGIYYKDYKEGYVKRPSDHNGTDIGSLDGKEIYSAADGTVWRNYQSNSYGNTVIIQSLTPEGEKIWSLYAHMKNPSSLIEGSKVLEGQNIGLVGNTGKSQGNHLHFGVNIGDDNGNFSFSQGWINPETINIGKYDYLEDIPAYQQKK